ncbi:MAG: DUF5765 domain-containing protein [Alphaproteobacteria bacterium]|nr:DUF5765 domain-containing protein [Alphaproteobacteria bacterium]
MCWSGEASAVLACAGFATAGYAAYQREPAPLWLALFYFSMMEALQAFTYSVIDECALPSNQIATLLGYLHITFQPFFINMLSLYFVPAAVRKKIAVWVYGACFISAIVMIIQLFPFEWAGQCDPLRPLCAERLCSVSGSWHIAWEVPANGLGNYLVRLSEPLTGSGFPSYGYPTYVLTWLVLPLLYGSWRVTLFHYVMGPFLARMTTDNLNEWPAVWCLLSIGILMIVVKTPLRERLHVRRWFWWPKAWRVPLPR